MFKKAVLTKEECPVLSCPEGILLSTVLVPSSYLNLLLKEQNLAKPSEMLAAEEGDL